MEENVCPGVYDDCRGMYNFFVLKHRIAQDGSVSAVQQDACPPFPGCIEEFHKYWCMDQCKLVFNNIQQIRLDMQQIMCRIAQSQARGLHNPQRKAAASELLLVFNQECNDTTWY
jgi:hypothetical protein